MLSFSNERINNKSCRQSQKMLFQRSCPSLQSRLEWPKSLMFSAKNCFPSFSLFTHLEQAVKLPSSRLHWLAVLQLGLLPGGEKEVEGGSLQLASLTRSHSGRYCCTADNNVGPPVTAYIDLNVICELFQYRDLLPLISPPELLQPRGH